MLRCSKSQTLHSYIPWRRHPHPRLVPGGRRGGRGGEPLPRDEGPQHSRPESHGFAGIVFKGLRGCLEAVNGFEDGWIRSYTVTVSLSSSFAGALCSQETLLSPPLGLAQLRCLLGKEEEWICVKTQRLAACSRNLPKGNFEFPRATVLLAGTSNQETSYG